MRSIAAAVALALGFLSFAPIVRADDPPATLMQQKHWKRVRAIAQAKLKASADDAKANYLMSRVLMAWNDSNAALPAEKAGSCHRRTRSITGHSRRRLAIKPRRQVSSGRSVWPDDSAVKRRPC